MECAAVKKFFESNKDKEKVIAASSTLIKLIQNASQNDDEKFQRVRLGNPRIQQVLLSQLGALDILIRVGFSKSKEEGNNGERMLIYRSTRQHQRIAQDTIRQLEARLERFAAAPGGASAFLTAEERKKRQEMAREKRKAQKDAKEEVMKRWQEDKTSRDELAVRNTAAKQVAMQTGNGGFAPGPNIHIKRISKATVTTPAPKPSPPVSSSTPESPAPSVPGTEQKKPPALSHPQTKPPDVVLGNQSDKQEETMSDNAMAPQSMDLEEDDDKSHDAALWANYVEQIPSCSSAEGIRETSIYWNKKSAQSSSFSALRPPCLRTLLRELDGMKESLPVDPRCSIWVRFDEETPQYMRAIITAALPGPTPYSGGLFCFDIYIPDDYPNVPPKATLLTTGGGTVRFGPNLYKDGKVCLSLLGTWPGPKWNPRISNVSQVLLSIQGLVLGTEHPYFLEPGHGGWEGTIKSEDFLATGQTLSGKVVKEDFLLPIEAAVYEDKLREGTLRYAILELVRGCLTNTNANTKYYLSPFQWPIHAHFYHNQGAILKEVKSWVHHNRSFAASSSTSKVTSTAFALQKLAARLETELAALKPPNPPAACVVSAPTASATDATSTGATTGATNDAATSLQEDKAMNKEESSLNVKHSPNTDIPNNLKSRSVATVVEQSRDCSMEIDKFVQEEHIDDLEEQVKTTASKAERAPEEEDDVDAVERLKELMHEAAHSKDFIKAGKLQEQITELEGLQRTMKKAADQGNFIRAGKLQEQFEARLSAVQDLPLEIQKQSKTMKDLMAPGPQVQAGGATDSTGFVDGSMDIDEEVDDSDDEDDFAGPPAAAAGFPHHPKNWFPPAGSQTRFGNAGHRWGGEGRTLVETETSEESSNVAGVAATATSPSVISRPPSGVICRLRIRLPDSKMLEERFDGNDSIGDVYRRINPHIQPSNDRNSASPANIAPTVTRTQVATPYGMHMVEAPAFSSPFSLNGYTLLLARPKREFSLEMDGTKSLLEMDLVPSATVTVMMCKERGVVRRGDLEGRFDAAQGDAMDVEGLSYESLLELTERVGASEMNWTPDDEQALEQNSSLLSPASYLAAKPSNDDDNDDGMGDGDEQERRCPICYGEFDPADTQPSLRHLKKCRHSGNIFHEACLRTWLKVKVSCPICKQSLTS